jgi:hypothetical protein
MLKYLIACAALVAGTSLAANVQLPGNTLTIPGTSTAGASFVYSGTLTQADRITLVQSGNPCLQAGGRTARTAPGC